MKRTILPLTFLFFLSFAIPLAAEGKVISIPTDEFIFQAYAEGNPSDPPVILLHGFPETSFMWRDLQHLLSREGFYTIAPDQRGYSPEARPRGRKSYSIDLLAEDVLKMADALGIERFHLIGHDWGSAVGWHLAAGESERIISWTALSVPHLSAFSQAIRNDEDQKEASTYMRLFQWPLLPELFLKAGQYKNLTAIWDQSSDEEIEAYMQVFEEKRALSSALNWYRANYRTLLESYDDQRPVTIPTLFIWGKHDPAILESAVEDNGKFVTAEYTEIHLDSGHWLIQESFEEVSEAVLMMLRENKDH